MSGTKKIAVIPGDGIGIDVTHEAMKVLEVIRNIYNLPLDVKHFDYGADRYLKDGTTMPEDQVEDFRNNFNAVFIGALGDPRVPDMAHARDILLGLRFKLDLFVNYRPIKLTDSRLCPLKDKTEEDIDFVVFRENTEGLYVGMGGLFKKGTPDEIAIQEDVNTRKGVERIIRYAFEFAKQKGRPKVTMSDKSNVLRFGHDLWQRTFEEVGEEYPDIEKEHFYVDALTMQMIKRPEQFEVIVTCNMFGDIVTDIGAQLQGGLGLAASGNINPDGTSMFEPVHGSAPKYAGKNVANPLAAILTLGLMLDYLGYSEQNSVVEKAVEEAIHSRNVTKDLAGNLGTTESGDFICEQIKSGL
ncbi:3-isopropylmalate dehydrogenase [candidate division KSB1 bacterium]|nr:3-isopropylmalate dehydrogenase [candidate division KSB1 bacterium]